MAKIISNIFDFSTVKRDAFSGALLVSEPFLDESFFRHAVVSLVDYDPAEGSMGLVLNNPTNLTLGAVFDNKVTQNADERIFCGGPMSLDHLYFLHTLGSDVIPGSREYAPGVYIGGDFDATINFVNAGYPLEGVLRFFVGYSGWSKGQLEEELSNNVWAIADMPHDRAVMFTGSSDSYWHRTIKTMGPQYRNWLLHPRDTNAN